MPKIYGHTYALDEIGVPRRSASIEGTCGGSLKEEAGASAPLQISVPLWFFHNYPSVAEIKFLEYYTTNSEICQGMADN